MLYDATLLRLMPSSVPVALWEMRWPSSQEWTAIGAIAAVLGVVVAIVIAVIVQKASTRGAESLRLIAVGIHRIARSSRRDEIELMLRNSGDPEQLGRLIEGGRELTAPGSRERAALESAYWSNPAAPLLSTSLKIPDGLTAFQRGELVKAVLGALPARYPAERMPVGLAADLSHLTRLALDLRADPYRIAAFVVGQTWENWTIGHEEVLNIIVPGRGYVCPPNIEACSDYLNTLRSPGVSFATLVNVLAGASFAVLEFDREAGRVPCFHEILTSYVMLLQRRGMDIGGNARDEGLTISADHAVAAAVHAIGVTAGEAHVTMRAVQIIPAVLSSFADEKFASSGVIADHLRDGVRLLLEKHPDDGYAERLRAAASRLVSGL